MARFSVGDRVSVRAAFPPGHVRTPYFVRGKAGTIVDIAGAFANPEELAYGRDGRPGIPLYHVLFRQTDLWPGYAGSTTDTAVVAIYEHWLEPARGSA
jgi:nitrile hydratase